MQNAIKIYNVFGILIIYPEILLRNVAQFGRALRSGRRGRVFESRHSDCLLENLFYT